MLRLQICTTVPCLHSSVNPTKTSVHGRHSTLQTDLHPRLFLRKQISKGGKGEASFGLYLGQYKTVADCGAFSLSPPIPLTEEFFLPSSLFGSFVVSGGTELVRHRGQSTYKSRFDPSFPSPGSHLSLACCQDPQVPSPSADSRIHKSCFRPSISL